jgi:enoyl-CoA hydratase/carnithine racemase
MTEHVKTEITDGVMTLTLRRPEKKNALTGAMYDALTDALKQAEADPSVRVVLFQGDGDSFTAGNDLSDFASQARGESAVDSPAHRFIETISEANKPLVAAVQGNAVGVGTTMLLHCDLVYLADNARLITPFVNLALVPEAASSWLLHCGSGTRAPTPCLRWASRWKPPPPLRVVSPMPWCRRESCANGRVMRR